MGLSKKPTSSGTRPPDNAEFREVQRLIAHERLSLDEPAEDRTCFLSHVGAQGRLVPCAWIGHRDLVYAMALANLNPAQRRSLAHAVLVEHGREFGVGRLELRALSSDLPLGGSSLQLKHRTGGPRCLYTWALGPAPQAAPCDWLLLRAQPSWAIEDAPRTLSASGLSTLVALGGEVVVLVPSAVAALQVASVCAGKIELAAHPRFSPYIEGLQPQAKVLLWPHDALESTGLRRHAITAVAMVSAPESVAHDANQWRTRLGGEASNVEVIPVACPGRIDRAGLQKFWVACERPRVILRGDPQWAAAGARWLSSLGATVEVQGEATQLSLV